MSCGLVACALRPQSGWTASVPTLDESREVWGLILRSARTGQDTILPFFPRIQIHIHPTIHTDRVFLYKPAWLRIVPLPLTYDRPTTSP